MVSLINFGMGLPPVVVGLATWLCLTLYGPLGLLCLIYTPTAMIVAQVIIATPIDLRRIVKIDTPSQRVRYELQEIGQPTLLDLLKEKFGTKK